LVSEFSEQAAYDYLKWGYDNYKRNGRWLKQALGDDYATKYQAFFLPSISSEEIENVAPLSHKGANGIVYSATLKRQPTGSDGEEVISVVLKQPKHPREEEDWQGKFVDEVFSIYDFLIICR